MLLALIQIIGYLVSINVLDRCRYQSSSSLSLLIAFNVVNLSNQFCRVGLAGIEHVILDPFLKPIRRIMPDTGMQSISRPSC